jgi:hypothetical protein
MVNKIGESVGCFCQSTGRWVENWKVRAWAAAISASALFLTEVWVQTRDFVKGPFLNQNKTFLSGRQPLISDLCDL